MSLKTIIVIAAVAFTGLGGYFVNKMITEFGDTKFALGEVKCLMDSANAEKETLENDRKDADRIDREIDNADDIDRVLASLMRMRPHE